MTAFDVLSYIMLPVCIFDIIGAVFIYHTVFKKEYGDKQDKK